VPLSAVSAGLKEVREVIASASRARRQGRRTLLFLDEIHRFNRAQQDALLPHVERGTVTLVGATTENPSFEVIGPLLSRCRVFTLRALSGEELITLLERALADPQRGLASSGLRATGEALEAMAQLADGDARRALGILETAVAQCQAEAGDEARAPAPLLDVACVQRAAGERLLLHDRDREEHYNLISALIKSLRASDPDAALYYLARLLGGGEDPLFVARRLLIFASEDVGNAEPAALPLALATHQALERIGMPEGRIPLSQAVTFLATAPKSNASYAAWQRANQAVEHFGRVPVPMHLRNAPTAWMKGQGYGQCYRNPHDEPDAFVAGPNLPEVLGNPHFYRPSRRGAEAAIAERLEAWRRRREQGGAGGARSREGDDAGGD